MRMGGATTSQRSHISSSSLSLMLVIGIAAQYSCSDTQPETSPEWTSTGPTSEVFNDLYYSESTNSLIAATGRNGIHIQSPAFTGSWKLLGLTLDDPRYIGSEVGAFSVTTVSSAMLVGFWRPWADSTSHIYRSVSNGWLPSDNGLSDRTGPIYSLLFARDGTVLAISADFIYASMDSGRSWLEREQLNRPRWGLLEEGPGGIWASAEFGSPIQSGLWHLTSGGETIEYRSLLSKLAPDSDVRVYSIAPLIDQLLIASGRRVYISNDVGETFQVLLETQEAVHLEVNPTNPLEMMAIADSLYVSENGGVSWAASSLPGRKLGRPAVDWDQRYLALPMLDQLGGSVYVRKLDDPES
jgi:hypothetical protein